MRFTIAVGRTIWLILLGLLCIPGLAVLWEWAQWRHCTINLPVGYGQLVVWERPSSPIFAEYDCFLQHNTHGRTGNKTRLTIRLGHRGTANVRWYPARDGLGPFVHLAGRDWDYLIDLREDTVYEVRTFDGTTYIGEVIRGNACWMMGGPGVMTFEDGHEESVTITDVICNAGPAPKFVDRVGEGPGTYLGSLDGQGMTFAPAK